MRALRNNELSIPEKESTNTRRVSVLDKQQLNHDDYLVTDKKMKVYAWLFFLLTLTIAFMKDGTVLMLSIPDIKDLQVYEGELSITRGGRRTTFLTINNEKRTVNFTCWITSKGLSDCLKKEQYPLYIGKKAKVYSYRAIINGIFYENRLMQLEVDDKAIMSYEEQRKRYSRLKDRHFYGQSIICFIALFWLILVYLRNSDELKG